jgi:hypothetical protein
MAKVRVLRLIEYTYADVEQMERDMERWSVQSSRNYGPVQVRTTTLPLEVLDDEDE